MIQANDKESTSKYVEPPVDAAFYDEIDDWLKANKKVGKWTDEISARGVIIFSRGRERLWERHHSIP